MKYRKKTLRTVVLIWLAALVCLPLVSCSAGTGGEKSGLPLVTATNFAVYDIARAVAGDTAEVSMLLPPETESHGYELTLSDAARIGRSDLLVCVGGESEDWVYDLVNSGDVTARVMIALTCVQTYEEDNGDRILEESGEEEEDDGEEPETDEHVWTSFGNIRAIARGVADELIALKPENAEAVEANLAAYLEELGALEEEYAALFRQTDRRLIAVADRFPFRYLAEEWGLAYVAAFSGCSSNVEASLATVNALVETVRQNGLPAVLKIELSDGRCADAVARETGCGVLTLQSGHNVTRAEFEAGVTLIDLMRQNLDVLRQVLG